MSTVAVIHADIVTPTGRRAAAGKDMRRLKQIADGALVATDGVITYVGATENLPVLPPDSRVIDAASRVVLPGFVDSHTHLIFGGYRPDEFEWRLKGDTYMSIMERGGGIQSTVNATRTMTVEDMVAKAVPYLEKMALMGVTTVEAKSGYGLETSTELNMLRAIRHLSEDAAAPVRLVATFLGAHAVPLEYSGRTSEYVDLIIREMLSAARPLATFCDVFTEKGVFELEDSRRLLQAAASMGYKLKMHADEIVTLGGAELAAELKAVSADHLLHVSDEGVKALAASETIATLLPLTAFSLKEPYAPARRLIDSGAAVALATDLNPGSCFSGSIPLMIALACVYMNMTVEETITALTLNGAAALDMAAETGSLETGKKADFIMLDFDNYRMLPYYVGMNCVNTVVREGRVIVSDASLVR